ncbi:unnamed protein product [Rhodiola kirilowii]
MQVVELQVLIYAVAVRSSFRCSCSCRCSLCSNHGALFFVSLLAAISTLYKASCCCIYARATFLIHGDMVLSSICNVDKWLIII